MSTVRRWCQSIKASTWNFFISSQCVKAQPYLEPKGIDYPADGKQRENPEGTEDGGQEELQPGPNAVMKGGVTFV